MLWVCRGLVRLDNMGNNAIVGCRADNIGEGLIRVYLLEKKCKIVISIRSHTHLQQKSALRTSRIMADTVIAKAPAPLIGHQTDSRIILLVEQAALYNSGEHTAH